MKLLVISAFLFCGLASLGAAENGRVRAAWFRTDITPPVGTELAGYGPHDKSVAVNDPLEACGLCVDDGSRKVLIVSFDLLGMDTVTIRDFRKAFAAKLGIPEHAVLLTCTHTHEGPHTRSYDSNTGADTDSMKPGKKNGLNVAYLADLKAKIGASVDAIASGKLWRQVRLGYHSVAVDENRNRRFTTADNCASFIAHRRTLHKIATGIADKELGTVVLLDDDFTPLYVIGNYAAHPLSAHAPGRGGLRISADFPGFYRRYLREETGAEAMFVQGAAGDIVAKGDELGLAAARRTGENLAMASIASVIDIQRNRERFVFSAPRVGSEAKTFVSPVRKLYRHQVGSDTLELEMQCVALGDICFVGVPGEIVSELGLEIKWHSPFRHAFIAYCATGYCGYVLQPNLVAAGGYEGQELRFASRDTLKMVGTAADAMFDLRAHLFPEDAKPTDDPYPDNLKLPLVNLPGGVKASKWK